MNPVRSYAEFQEFMKNFAPSYDKPIPILLIRPCILRSFRENPHLYRILDYFNHRTAENITFFLPGYSHNPSTSFHNVFSEYGYNDDSESVFDFKHYRLGEIRRIVFSDKDYTDFIKTLEEKSIGFRYYGDTELLLLPFISGKGSTMGDLDFLAPSNHRYNLSSLFFRGREEYFGSYLVEHFLESVYHDLLGFDSFRNIDDFYNSIDAAYNRH